MERSLVVALLVAIGVGCTPPLPDAETPGAVAYAERCGGCHRIYAPGSLTADMWDVMLARMDKLITRRGLRPLSEDERVLIGQYLRAHSSDTGDVGA